MNFEHLPILTDYANQNQRLPGACNRSPGSKLLSITTQLHCGGHLGGRAQLPDTFLEKNHPMTFIIIQFLLSKWFQTRRYLWEFPIRSYVKLSSAVVAILVGGLKCRTQFWKGTTQRSFQQSLVEIGAVVSEENIFFKFHSPFFSIFSLPAILVESRDHRTQIWKGAMQRRFHQSLVAIGF